MEEKTKMLIGKILFSTDLGLCDIFFYVETDEENNCFHIKNSQKDICIGISRAEYYGNDKLSELEKTELIHYLNGNIRNSESDNIGYSTDSVWEQMANYWNFVNDNDEILSGTKMPDYSLL